MLYTRHYAWFGAKNQLSGNLTTGRQWKRQEIKRALISEWLVEAIVKENDVRVDEILRNS